MENKIETLEELKQFKVKTRNEVQSETNPEQKQMLKMLYVSTCQAIEDLQDEIKNE